MKKTLVPVILASLLFLAAGEKSSRQTSAEALAKEMVNIFKTNDTLRYIELFPTREEMKKFMVDCVNDPMVRAEEEANINLYLKNNHAYLLKKFRQARQRVIKNGGDWATVAFSSVVVHEMKTGKTIDSLYVIDIHCLAGKQSLLIKLSHVMQTTEGWNCGTKFSFEGELFLAEQRARQAQISADSMRMARFADSMNKANEKQPK